MSDKKLFPGVTPEEVIRKEQEEAQKKLEIEQKLEQIAREQDRQNKRSIYILPETELLSDKQITVKFIRQFVSTCGWAFLAGSFAWTLWGASFGHWTKGAEPDNIKRRSINYTDYTQALYDAYIPISNGKTKLLNTTTPVERGKFAPTIGFIANMLVTLIGICGAVGISYRQKKRNSEIILHNNTVDMMLDLEEFKGNYNLNTYQVARMINDMSDIIREMSADKRVYFDMILDGRINIRKNDTFLKMATHIMQGHLAKHPDDINKILDVYNWRSVPLNLLTEYDQYITDRSYKTR